MKEIIITLTHKEAALINKEKKVIGFCIDDLSEQAYKATLKYIEAQK